MTAGRDDDTRVACWCCRLLVSRGVRQTLRKHELGHTLSHADATSQFRPLCLRKRPYIGGFVIVYLTSMYSIGPRLLADASRLVGGTLYRQRSFGPTSLLARTAIAVTPPPWFLWLPLADFPQRSFAGGVMEALRKFVLRQNVVGMTTPPVLRGAQSLVGMTGASDVTAAARWGAVLGLTAFWFIGALRVEATRGVRRRGEGPWSANGATMSECHCGLSAALFGCLTVCPLCGDCCFILLACATQLDLVHASFGLLR